MRDLKNKDRVTLNIYACNECPRKKEGNPYANQVSQEVITEKFP